MGLGVILLLYCLSWFLKVKIPTPGENEKWLNPIMGGLTGVSTGLTGTFVVPEFYICKACNWIGTHWFKLWGYVSVATISLGVSLGGRGILNHDLVFISGAMVIPALIGMC